MARSRRLIYWMFDKGSHVWLLASSSLPLLRLMSRWGEDADHERSRGEEGCTSREGYEGTSCRWYLASGYTSSPYCLVQVLFTHFLSAFTRSVGYKGVVSFELQSLKDPHLHVEPSVRLVAPLALRCLKVVAGSTDCETGRMGDLKGSHGFGEDAPSTYIRIPLRQ